MRAILQVKDVLADESGRSERMAGSHRRFEVALMLA